MTPTEQDKELNYGGKPMTNSIEAHKKEWKTYLR